MTVLAFPETISASRNALLSAKLSKTLRTVAASGQIDARGVLAAERGAALLSRIIQGSLIIESGQPSRGGLSPSPEGLRDYGKALTAINMLPPTSGGTGVAALLEGFRGRLLKLAETRSLPSREASELDVFFTNLNLVFYSEVQQPITAPHQDAPAGSRARQ